MEMEPEAIMKQLAGHLNRRKMPRHWPYHLFLARHAHTHITHAGYRWLAALLQDGYFSTVVTVNPEPFLEEMLDLLDSKPSAYRVLIAGRDSDTLVADALQGSPSGISIVKLLAHTSSERAFTPLYTQEVLISLQYYLCHNIIIVGSLEHDLFFTSILHTMSTLNPVNTTGSIYYTLPEKPDTPDPLLTIRMLNDQLRTPFIISGNAGTFEGFFSHLASILHVSSHLKLLNTFSTPALCSRKAMPIDNTVHINRATADILLVTVTGTETNAVLTFAPNGYKSITLGRRTYYDLGIINTNRTFLVRATSPGALEAFSTVKDGIEALTPQAAIMVGIAFGYDKGKQQIGDIMVATQIQDYDLKRVGSTATREQVVRLRGLRVPTSQPLLDRFLNGPYTIHTSWPNAPAIHAGLILSGSSLVDHEEYRDQLRHAAPDAIGGEMEGAGLLKAAIEAEQKVDWILVKAISDWADGTKSTDGIEKQRMAAENAARFIFQVIEQPGFLSRRV
jgi:nucleoside phosphorylase